MSLVVLPCLDSDELAIARRQELDIQRNIARMLGISAVDAIQRGYYTTESGSNVDWGNAIEMAVNAKTSIPPGKSLRRVARAPHQHTKVQVTNETTLGAARRLIGAGLKPLALNFANGIHPGGGFLNGARAQEEALCRSSGLFATLRDDPMYDAHRQRTEPDSTEWAILSPDVPVFRADDGQALDSFWLLSFITCAAPYAPEIGQPKSAQLLRERINRVLDIARAFDYQALVLGAWGCGAFENDVRQTASDFKNALDGEFVGAFGHVTFAVTDWSTDRRFLGPFRDVFSEDSL
jgi:uncharacterized protein (TIGR02452 family)